MISTATPNRGKRQTAIVINLLTLVIEREIERKRERKRKKEKEREKLIR